MELNSSDKKLIGTVVIIMGLHLMVAPLVDVGMGLNGFLGALVAETDVMRLGFMGVYLVPPVPFSPLGAQDGLLFLVRFITWVVGVGSVLVVWLRFQDLPGWRRIIYAYLIAALLSSFNPPIGAGI